MKCIFVKYLFQSFPRGKNIYKKTFTKNIRIYKARKCKDGCYIS